MSRSIYTKLKQQKINRKKKELKDKATASLAVILLSGEEASCINCVFKEFGEYWYDEDGHENLITPKPPNEENPYNSRLRGHYCRNKHRLEKNRKMAAFPKEEICGFYEIDPKKKKKEW